jgi:hypothetical protein
MNSSDPKNTDGYRCVMTICAPVLNLINDRTFADPIELNGKFIQNEQNEDKNRCGL